MKKADGILIAVLMALCLGLLIPLMQHRQGGSHALVSVQGQEVMRLDLSKDGTYTANGTLGPVNIEVSGGSVRVTQENSPHHYCSLQGWTSSPNAPIVCLPNDTVVQIEKQPSDSEEEQEDTMIQ